MNLDTTVANGVPTFIREEDYVTEVGAGAGIKLRDGVVMPNPKVVDHLVTVAETQQIECQREVLPAGGTDTGPLQYGSGAKPVGAISTPARHLHTPTEAAHADDVGAVVDLASAFLTDLDGAEEYAL